MEKAILTYFGIYFHHLPTNTDAVQVRILVLININVAPFFLVAIIRDIASGLSRLQRLERLPSFNGHSWHLLQFG
jgi:hypothetical protein